MLILLTACGGDKATVKESEQGMRQTILLGDPGWESISVHNEIVKIILEKGYGYNIQFVTASSEALRKALRNENLDISMEYWIYNDREYEDIEKGLFVIAGANFKGYEGIYVPKYVIEGDQERGIAPYAPDLKSVEDLNRYYEIFKENPSAEKGLLHGAVKGWVAKDIMESKWQGYSLNEKFDKIVLETAWGYDSALIKAYESGKPWVGYYWEPTAIMGEFEMVKLEEIAYDKGIWENNKLCDFPNNDVEIAVSKSFQAQHPEVFEFLQKYNTGTPLNNEILYQKKLNNWSAEETAIWFLDNYEEIWHKWLPADIIEHIKQKQ